MAATQEVQRPVSKQFAAQGKKQYLHTSQPNEIKAVILHSIVTFECSWEALIEINPGAIVNHRLFMIGKNM